MIPLGGGGGGYCFGGRLDWSENYFGFGLFRWRLIGGFIGLSLFVVLFVVLSVALSVTTLLVVLALVISFAFLVFLGFFDLCLCE